MGIINDILSATAGWVNPHMGEIVFAMIASLLIIYGDLITGITKKMTARFNFFVRVTVFVLVAAFGFTLIASFLTPLLADLLSSTGKWVFFAVLGLFYIIGILAQKRGQA